VRWAGPRVQRQHLQGWALPGRALFRRHHLPAAKPVAVLVQAPFQAGGGPGPPPPPAGGALHQGAPPLGARPKRPRRHGPAVAAAQHRRTGSGDAAGSLRSRPAPSTPSGRAAAAPQEVPLFLACGGQHLAGGRDAPSPSRCCRAGAACTRVNARFWQCKPAPAALAVGAPAGAGPGAGAGASGSATAAAVPARGARPGLTAAALAAVQALQASGGGGGGGGGATAAAGPLGLPGTLAAGVDRVRPELSLAALASVQALQACKQQAGLLELCGGRAAPAGLNASDPSICCPAGAACTYKEDPWYWQCEPGQPRWTAPCGGTKVRAAAARGPPGAAPARRQPPPGGRGLARRRACAPPLPTAHCSLHLLTAPAHCPLHPTAPCPAGEAVPAVRRHGLRGGGGRARPVGLLPRRRQLPARQRGLLELPTLGPQPSQLRQRQAPHAAGRPPPLPATAAATGRQPAAGPGSTQPPTAQRAAAQARAPPAPPAPACRGTGRAAALPSQTSANCAPASTAFSARGRHPTSEQPAATSHQPACKLSAQAPATSPAAAAATSHQFACKQATATC
jgi:hypothetical protein